MKTTGWAIVLILVGGAAVLAFSANDYVQNQKTMARELDTDRHVFQAFSEKCRQAFSSTAKRQVLDWSGVSGPFRTSTGDTFNGRADLGDSKIDVSCYFDSQQRILNVTTKNSHKDPYTAIRDAASGN